VQAEEPSTRGFNMACGENVKGQYYNNTNFSELLIFLNCCVLFKNVGVKTISKIRTKFVRCFHFIMTIKIK